MKSIYLAIFFIVIFPIISLAIDDDTKKTQTDANIIGHVVDAKTNEHLADVTINVKGTTIGIVSDKTGHFFLKNMPVGEFLIVASHIGYKTSEQKVKTTENTTIELNFSMDENAVKLDEIVVSATRNETKKREAPIIVNVVSSKFFEATASTNLAESMNFQSGLRVETNCSNCGITQLRINGLDGQYSQILIDSRPVVSSLATVYGLEQLPVSMIERVEVIRGGGSALFGSSAIGGVVNIITKEPLKNSISLSNNTNIFNDGKTDMNTSFSGSFVSDDYKAGIYIFGLIKNRNWYDRNNDGFSDIPKLKSEAAGFKAYYRTSNYSRLTAEYHHIHEYRRGGNNFNEPPHLADIGEYLNPTIDGGGLRFNIYTPDHKHRFEIYTSTQIIKRDSYFAAEKNTDNYGNTLDKTFIAGSQYSYDFGKFLGAPAELTAGIEYNYNNLNETFITLNRHLEQSANIIGGFFQNEWKTEKLGILIGARLDKHNLIKQPTFNPRVTIRYNLNADLNLRLNYSSGYRAPQIYSEDFHVTTIGGTLSMIQLAEDLRPEYSHSFSLSADFYHDFGKIQSNLLVESFYTVLDDVFTEEKTGEDNLGNFIYVRRNGSGATVKGINAELKFGLPDVFDIQMGYTLQQSKYKNPEQWSDVLTPQRKMPRSPENYGYISSNFYITHDFKTSVFGNYTGAMLVRHTLPDTDAEKTTPDFFDFGIKLSYNIHFSESLNIELSGGIKNIFDSYQKDPDYGQTKDSTYIYGPGFPRMLFFGVKIAM
ncbi:MAG: TonB-dependent receptor [Prevotellaceae bacterium]|jgi:outer membrane receptor for ferrienterochelin and colicins|nr:TonB-dependent receptor [Prevotellaceae bacterium]